MCNLLHIIILSPHLMITLTFIEVNVGRSVVVGVGGGEGGVGGGGGEGGGRGGLEVKDVLPEGQTQVHFLLLFNCALSETNDKIATSI